MFDRYDVENPANQRKFDLVEDLEIVADKVGVSLLHMSLAWTLAHLARSPDFIWTCNRQYALLESFSRMTSPTRARSTRFSVPSSRDASTSTSRD